MATFELHTCLLRAARLFAAEDDIRYYLNGVLVEIESDSVRYVATNGHCLAVLRDDFGGIPARLIIPVDAIDMLPPFDRQPSVSVALTYDPSTPEAECRLGAVMFRPIIGKYPDYRKVVPETVTGVWKPYKVMYLNRFQEAVTTAYGDFELAEVWPNGDGPALVTCGKRQFTGALMPFKHEGSPEFAQWAREPEAVAA